MGEFLFTVLSCAFFMFLVAWYSYIKTRNTINDSTGYFLAGRGLTGGFIAGSLILTNLSAEQLIGLNGQSYSSNMTSMAWEVTAGLSVIILALILLPRYLGGAFTTLPEFIDNRFDQGTRIQVVMLFMLGYGLVTIPSVLYSGAIAVLQLFDVPSALGISFEQSMWLVVWIIGIIGSCYAIFGGLKAVAISDTLNGIGLFIVGLIVPVLGFIALGDGNMLQGMKTITVESPEKLNAIGSSDDGVPFGTIFTGMIFANLFYWGTNQYAIQRTLGAQSLAEGQKGALLTGFLKILVPFLMMIPGIIAFHLYGPELGTMDLAYPALISDLLPTFLNGFFLAVLLGAVFSSFNSLLNSAATMFAYDIYKVLINKNATDRQMIRVSQWFGVVLSLVTFFIAPLLLNAPDGLWTVIREFTGFFNIPIIAIVLAGIFSKRIPPIGPKIAITVHVVTYFMLMWGLPMFFGIEVPINFIHIQGMLFVLAVAIMLSAGMIRPLAEPYRFTPDAKVSMVPWKYAIPVTVILFSAMVFSFVLFSEVGFASEEGIVSGWFLPVVLMQIVVTVVLYVISLKSWNRKYQEFVKGRHERRVEEAEVY
ncbi:solute:sodium symporter family transporter [Salinicoccus halodurans]|uniref:Sodium transporter n=1 Tax=Salinicoccus halodurans TaxID=407035 RepID=A0A0F7HK79_9STAP|nr:solute:sodium symporter family transporter [Salinicoccus halodurans]AKG73524.1 sodium transporter [Salinicoccus halodurans]SFK52039.1 solute:Na+ symporter, SSS family [Salinicoccus halodurans]